jgi:peptide/nickel transport system substrate-binding protein
MKRTALWSIGAVALACAAAPAFAQKSKDTLRFGLDQPIQTISYYLDPKPETVFEIEAVFDNLIIFNEKTLKYEPLLAKSWKQIDDKTIEYELRDDIKWHDGEKFDADDVLYTFNWVLDPKTQLRFKGNWEFIDRLEKTGPYTVRVIAKRPTPYALVRLAYLSPIEAEHAHGKAADKVVYGATKPIGTGMYKVVEVDRNKHILLERNKDYNHGGPAKTASNIGRIQMMPIPDTGTQIAQFLVGGVDFVRDPGLEAAEDLAKKPGIQLTLSQGVGLMYMAIDAKGRSGLKQLQDVRVRRALMMAINRKDMLQFLTGGRPERTPKAMCWELQAGCAFTKEPYPFDPAGAKKLLTEAGFGDGFDLEITTFTGEATKGAAQIVANQLHQIGIRASVQPSELGAYRKKQGDGKIQVIVAAWPGGGNPDVQGTMEFIYAVPDARDYAGDAEMKELAFKSLTIMNPEERKRLGQKIFDMSTERAYFTPVGPNPAVFVHTAEVAIEGGAFNAYYVNPQGFRWK